MKQFKPKDLIAFFLIAGLILFKLTGNNGDPDEAVALVVGYYYAHRRNGDDKGV